MYTKAIGDNCRFEHSPVREPAEVMPWYWGLTPDFFYWLERS
jgi:hypothetical protein